MKADAKIEIKQLTEKFDFRLRELIKAVVENMDDPEWLIVLTEDEINNIFNNEKAILYGLVDSGVGLLAISGLFFDEEDFKDITKKMGIDEHKVAEIGESMVHPNERGRGYMYKINVELIKKAKQLGFEYVIATAHPDNIASNSSLKKLGMECTGQINRYGKYLRNCYVMKICEN